MMWSVGHSSYGTIQPSQTRSHAGPVTSTDKSESAERNHGVIVAGSAARQATPLVFANFGQWDEASSEN
jgi:hypothetical protein